MRFSKPDHNMKPQRAHSHEWSMSNFSCGLSINITSHSVKTLAFHSLLRRKDDYTNSHYLTYLFIFDRLGERTFWTWEWIRNATHRWFRVCCSWSACIVWVLSWHPLLRHCCLSAAERHGKIKRKWHGLALASQGGFQYEKVGDACQELLFRPLRGTKKGLAQAFSDSWKVPKMRNRKRECAGEKTDASSSGIALIHNKGFILPPKSKLASSQQGTRCCDHENGCEKTKSK